MRIVRRALTTLEYLTSRACNLLATTVIRWAGRGTIEMLGDGKFCFKNTAGTTGVVLDATINNFVWVRQSDGTGSGSITCSSVALSTLFSQSPNVALSWGTGNPEGSALASPGAIRIRTDGGVGTTLYVKESGTATTTGWVAK